MLKKLIKEKGKAVERWRRKATGLKPKGHDCRVTHDSIRKRLWGRMLKGVRGLRFP